MGQAEIGGDLVGAGEALGVVDDAREAGRGDGADAGNRRQSAADGIGGGLPHQQPVEPLQLVCELGPCGEQRDDGRAQAWHLLQPGLDPCGQPARRGARQHQAQRLHQPADLVEEIALDAHQPFARGQERVPLEARPALEPYHLESSAA